MFELIQKVVSDSNQICDNINKIHRFSESNNHETFISMFLNFNILNEQDTNKIKSFLGTPDSYLSLTCEEFKIICIEILYKCLEMKKMELRAIILAENQRKNK